MHSMDDGVALGSEIFLKVLRTTHTSCSDSRLRCQQIEHNKSGLGLGRWAWLGPGLGLDELLGPGLAPAASGLKDVRKTNQMHSVSE